jgi:DNA-binding MarR family transcriptional regulator
MMSDSRLLGEVEHISDIFTRILMKTMTVDLTSEEITEAQFQALRHIAGHGSSTVGGLAEGLSISQPAATTMVDRMSKRGFVERQPGRIDRRQAEITLTERAVSLMEEIERDRAERLGRILEEMGDSERRQLLESLEGFVAAALKSETSIEGACLRCGSEHHAGCIVNRAQLQRAGKEVERT